MDKINGIYYSPTSRDRYILLKINEASREVYWLGDDGHPMYGNFGNSYAEFDRYVGQASDLMLALI